MALSDKAQTELNSLYDITLLLRLFSTGNTVGIRYVPNNTYKVSADHNSYKVSGDHNSYK